MHQPLNSGGQQSKKFGMDCEAACVDRSVALYFIVSFTP